MHTRSKILFKYMSICFLLLFLATEERQLAEVLKRAESNRAEASRGWPHHKS